MSQYCIEGRNVVIYDLEVLQNIFIMVCKDLKTGDQKVYEISNRKNDIEIIKSMFNKVNSVYCGYNNHHYDDIIINFILSYYPEGKSVSPMVLYQFSQYIINRKNKEMTIKRLEDTYKEVKHKRYFHSVDLMKMLFSYSTRVSLEQLQVYMNYKSVESFNHDWKEQLNPNRFDELIEYAKNDVDSTVELFNRSEKLIQLRKKIKEKYNIDCYSMDNVTLGMEILKTSYLSKTNKNEKDIMPYNGRTTVFMHNILLPFIKFEDHNIIKMYEKLRLKSYTDGDPRFNLKFEFKGLKYSVGLGGLHTINKPEIFRPREDELLINLDVQSQFPSMIEKFKFYPKHLDDVFLDIYSEIKQERIKAIEENDELKNITLKFALNGPTGNLQNPNSWMYDLNAALSIRINAQMLLLMLIEQLSKIGVKIAQANTDGIYVLLKKEDYDTFSYIYNKWEELSGLKLDETRYEALFQSNVNSLFAIKEGFTEAKGKVSKDILFKEYIIDRGDYRLNNRMGRAINPVIIPRAVVNYFTFKEPISTFIRKDRDIRNFIMFERSSAQFKVFLDGVEQQKTNRFYASKNGGILTKEQIEITNTNLTSLFGGKIRRGKKSVRNILEGSTATIVNVLENTEDHRNNVDERYYIEKARKLADSLEKTEEQPETLF